MHPTKACHRALDVRKKTVLLRLSEPTSRFRGEAANDQRKKHGTSALTSPSFAWLRGRARRRPSTYPLHHCDEAAAVRPAVRF